ncbi:hypothetical protein DRJ04_01375, partial [Candidatus Aerophobetes bacterium]
MAIAEMRKVLLIGEKEFRERVVKKLGEAGIFQSIPLNREEGLHFLQPPEIKTASLQDALNKLEAAINFLNRFEEKKFDLGLFPAKIMVSPKEYSEWIRNFKWEKICERCSSLENEIEKIKEEISSLQEEYINLLPWRKISFPLSKLKNLRYLDFRIGIIPSEAKSLLLKLVENEAIH